MTYGETTVGQTIGRLPGEHPDLDPSADGALDNVDQFHIGPSRPCPATEVKSPGGLRMAFPGRVNHLRRACPADAGAEVQAVGWPFGGDHFRRHVTREDYAAMLAPRTRGVSRRLDTGA
jgi:hypothetical protein